MNNADAKEAIDNAVGIESTVQMNDASGGRVDVVFKSPTGLELMMVKLRRIDYGKYWHAGVSTPNGEIMEKLQSALDFKQSISECKTVSDLIAEGKHLGGG